ncbi:MAG: flagella E, partial [Myxococcota bacterium]
MADDDKTNDSESSGLQDIEDLAAAFGSDDDDDASDEHGGDDDDAGEDLGVGGFGGEAAASVVLDEDAAREASEAKSSAPEPEPEPEP